MAQTHRHEGLGQYDAALDDVRGHNTSSGRPPATVVNDLQEAPIATPENNAERLSIAVTSRSEAADYRKGAPNEDALIVDEGLQLFAVLDGMGGHAAGDEASRVAAKSLATSGLTEPTTPGAQAVTQSLVQALEKAHHDVVDAIDAGGGEKDGMGTAATVTRITEQTDGTWLSYASVTDTRLYVLHNGVIRLLTEDEGSGSIVTNALGVERDWYKGVRPQNRGEVKLEPGMRFLLCSDGITGDTEAQLLSDAEVAKALSNPDADAGIGELFEVSRKDDDTTAIIIDVAGAETSEITPQDSEAEENVAATSGPKPKGRTRGGRGGGAEARRKAERDARRVGGDTADSPDDVPPSNPDDVADPAGGEWTSFDSEPLPPRADGEGPDDFNDWEFLFPNSGAGGPEAPTNAAGEPDYSHLPPPPSGSGEPDYSHLPPPPSSPEADDATPYTPEQLEQMDLARVSVIRNALGQMQTRKRWGFAYGIMHRGEMNNLRDEYEEAVCSYNQRVVLREIQGGILSSDYEDTLDRIEELEAEEGARFIDANVQAELSKYGKAIRWVGDKVYGRERSGKRKLLAGAGMGAMALGAAAFAPAVPALAGAAVGLRLIRTWSGGVYGHDSEQGTKRILTKVTAKASARQGDRETIDTDGLSPAELDQLIADRDSSFRETYLDSVNKSDTKRRTASMAGQIAGVGAIMGAGHLLKDLAENVKMPKLPFVHSGGGSGSSSGFKNLSPDDVQKFKDASPGINHETLAAIDKNPEAFNRFVTTGQEIKQSTGLTGTELNERIADTLALAHTKSEYIAAARNSGITAEAAGAAFDQRIAEMVFADAVSHIRATTGLTGPELLKRVKNTAALAQARESFVSQGTSAVDRFNRQRLFDEQFKQYIAKLKK